ncbi:PTS system, sucrose-specific IIABC component [Williamsoniiplasma somnilux]|uniref:PTS system, sucrose-specific IIABC component n=1 Tax=Williamsoniiplasma somnilux TaxID=215578 RepID=A0A2K8NX54_9MOLU|nr:PTS transporter subunit EIIC [Williamsoniiplasma somnilux]ATZ18399.1 PTS system, sucrose-specific IIABC component [Williamsoniiplasma somnilux]
MSKNNKQNVLIQNILNKIGGSDNVKDVYNCATRMRLTLFNSEIVKINDLKTITNLKGVLWSNGELQIIIGPEVSVLTDAFKVYIQKNMEKNSQKYNQQFKTTNQINSTANKIPIWRKFLKSVSAIFGPLIPFLIGVGLIMALQQFLIRTGAAHAIEDNGVLGKDYNIFDYVLNVIAGTGFKLMGVIAIWSTVRYLGGKTPIALALGLIMISPIIPEAGIHLMTLGDWNINLKPFYSTILVFILMGVILANAQKLMDKYFNSVANFILNPLLNLLIGGLLAFFFMGPIMGVIENALLTAFNWFMTLPFGLGALVVGLTWQPLVVLGVHNILFFAAVTDIVSNGNPSIFLAAAFAAAWAQMGATLGVALRSKKSIDKSSAIAAALPGIISGPTESCIYAVNLPKGKPFITGVIAGGIGGWMIGIFGINLDNLAGLGGVVGFLAYTDDLWKAIVIDLSSLILGVLITILFWKEEKTEQALIYKITKQFNKAEFLNSKNDYQAKEIIKLIEQENKNKDKEKLINKINLIKIDLIKFDPSLSKVIDIVIENIKTNKIDNNSKKELVFKLSSLKTTRQTKLNETYLDLKKYIKTLKSLSAKSNKLSTLTIKKENLEFKINKIFEINEAKNASLFNKGNKLSNSKNINKIAKGNQMIELSKNYDSSFKKITSIKNKILEIEKQLVEANDFLSKDTKDIYKNIEKYINKIQEIKKTKMNLYKDQYFNAIHKVEIKSNFIEPKCF